MMNTSAALEDNFSREVYWGFRGAESIDYDCRGIKPPFVEFYVWLCRDEPYPSIRWNREPSIRERHEKLKQDVAEKFDEFVEKGIMDKGKTKGTYTSKTQQPSLIYSADEHIRTYPPNWRFIESIEKKNLFQETNAVPKDLDPPSQNALVSFDAFKSNLSSANVFLSGRDIDLRISQQSSAYITDDYRVLLNYRAMFSSPECVRELLEREGIPTKPILETEAKVLVKPKGIRYLFDSDDLNTSNVKNLSNSFDGLSASINGVRLEDPVNTYSLISRMLNSIILNIRPLKDNLSWNEGRQFSPKDIEEVKGKLHSLTHYTFGRHHHSILLRGPMRSDQQFVTVTEYHNPIPAEISQLASMTIGKKLSTVKKAEIYEVWENRPRPATDAEEFHGRGLRNGKIKIDGRCLDDIETVLQQTNTYDELMTTKEINEFVARQRRNMISKYTINQLFRELEVETNLRV